MIMLLRQIHPSQIQANGVASSAFRPSKKDEGLLSMYDGTKFSAENAYDHYTIAGYSSEGILGITREEFLSVDLNCINDNHGFDGHVSVDYRKESKGQCERKSKIIRDIAVKRSWLYKKSPSLPKEAMTV